MHKPSETSKFDKCAKVAANISPLGPYSLMHRWRFFPLFCASLQFPLGASPKPNHITTTKPNPTPKPRNATTTPKRTIESIDALHPLTNQILNLLNHVTIVSISSAVITDTLRTRIRKPRRYMTFKGGSNSASSIRLFAHNFLDSAENIKSTSTPIFNSIDMTSNSDDDNKKKILSMIGSPKGNLNSSQLASMLQIGIDDVERLLIDLQTTNLIEKGVGDYYHLTYEGYRALKNLTASKRLW